MSNLKVKLLLKVMSSIKATEKLTESSEKKRTASWEILISCDEWNRDDELAGAGIIKHVMCLWINSGKPCRVHKQALTKLRVNPTFLYNNITLSSSAPPACLLAVHFLPFNCFLFPLPFEYWISMPAKVFFTGFPSGKRELFRRLWR